MLRRRAFLKGLVGAGIALAVMPTLADAEALARASGALPPRRLYPSAYSGRDDAAYLQALLDAQANQPVIRLPRPGTYYLARTLRVATTGTRLLDGGGARLVATRDFRGECVVWGDGAMADAATIRNFFIDRTLSPLPDPPPPPDPWGMAPPPPSFGPISRLGMTGALSVEVGGEGG